MKAGFGLFLLAGCTLSLQAVEPLQSSPFVVGVCTHFSQDKGLLPANLDLIRQAHVASIRDEVVWAGVEKEKGRLEMPREWDLFVRRAAADGVQPLLILDYGNRFYDNGDKPLSPEAQEAFTRYAEFVVRHFKGVVHHYEVWNEYDIKIGSLTPGTAETYVQLLKKVYPRIKAIDPSITVYGGAMTPTGIRNGWLEKMLSLDALSFLDVVSIHTYNYGLAGRERTPEGWADWMRQVEQQLVRHNAGKAVPFYITEMGWPTQLDKRGMAPALSAAYLARMYLLSRTIPALRGIWWYDFQDDGWNAAYNEDNFGIVRPDLSPKPAYLALAAIAKIVGNAEFVGASDTGDPDVPLLKFESPEGGQIWAVWSAHPEDDWQLELESEADSPGPISITPVGSMAIQRPWGERHWVEGRQAPVSSGRLEITVRDTPWLISGDLSRVRVVSVKRRPRSSAATAGLSASKE